MRTTACSTRTKGGFRARVHRAAGVAALALGGALVLPAILLTTTSPVGAATGSASAPVKIPAVNCGHGQDVNCGSVTVSKTDSWTGDPVAGATFTMYEANHQGTVCDTSKEPKDLTENPMTTDSTGSVTFTPLKDQKSYCVVETGAPPGYTASSDPVFVSVMNVKWDHESEAWVCAADKGNGPSIESVTNDSEHQDSVCVTNASFTDDPIPVTITVSKFGVGGAGLPGATFTLQHTDGSAVTTGTGGVVSGSTASCTTSGGSATTAATCSISGIMIAGSYQLAETAAPTGYTGVSPIPVTVTLGVTPVQVVATDSLTPVTPPPTAAGGGTSGGGSSAVVPSATTVHTGEPFAGATPYVAAMALVGGSLLGLGMLRRRAAARQL